MGLSEARGTFGDAQAGVDAGCVRYASESSTYFIIYYELGFIARAAGSASGALRRGTSNWDHNQMTTPS